VTAPPPPAVEVDPRVTFAAERTQLAWVRTGLSLMGFGFVVARFGLMMAELAPPGAARPAPDPSATAVGTVLVAIGILVNLWASIDHVRTMRRLARGETIDPRARGPVIFATITVLGGIALLVLLTRGVPG
jgi:putative membrane protein